MATLAPDSNLLRVLKDRSARILPEIGENHEIMEPRGRRMARYRAESVGRLRRRASARERNGPNSLRLHIYLRLYLGLGAASEIAPANRVDQRRSPGLSTVSTPSHPSNFKYKLYS